MSASEKESEAVKSEVADLLMRGDLVPICALVDETIVLSSSRLCSMFDRPSLVGTCFWELVSIEDRSRVRAFVGGVDDQEGQPLRIVALGSGRRPFQVELRVARSSDSSLRVLSIFDVTEQVARESRLNALAYHDSLTGLSNRLLFQDRAERLLAASKRSGLPVTLMVIDLDGFKAVNDKLGHAAGDEVLKQTAQRLEACVREGDTVARLGGDEFSVLLPDASTREAAALVAARMLEALVPPIVVGQSNATVGASIGIAMSPGDGIDLESLIQSADRAMYIAKGNGKNRFEFAQVDQKMSAESCPSEGARESGLALGEMDEQDAALFSMIQGLHDAESQDSRAIVDEVGLRELLALTAAHFSAEEQTMREVGYEGFVSHRREHARLLDDLGSLAQHAESLSSSLVKRFLRDWLIGHIKTYDRGVARAVARARALKNP